MTQQAHHEIHPKITRRIAEQFIEIYNEKGPDAATSWYDEHYSSKLSIGAHAEVHAMLQEYKAEDEDSAG